jgi:hypothetical protein
MESRFIREHEQDYNETLGYVFKKLICESSLSRFWWYLQEHQKAVAMITALKKEFDFEEAKKINVQLSCDIRLLKYGFIRLIGQSDEDVLFIIDHKDDPETFKHEMVELARKHGRDKIVFKYPDLNKVFLIDIECGNELSLGRWHPNKLGRYYSKMRNEKILFKFEEANIRYFTEDFKNKPSGFFGCMAFDAMTKHKKIL